MGQIEDLLRALLRKILSFLKTGVFFFQNICLNSESIEWRPKKGVGGEDKGPARRNIRLRTECEKGQG